MSNIFKIGLCALLLTACKYQGEECIQTPGDEAEQSVGFGSDVTAISVENRINVTIIQDSLYFAEIKFGENLIDGVKIVQEGETLRVYNTNKCTWTRPKNNTPDIVLHIGPVSYISSSNAGTMKSDNIKSEKLLIESRDASGILELNLDCTDLSVAHHTGITDFILSGKADIAFFYSKSRTPFQASGLECRSLAVHNEGYGDMNVRASEFFFYQIYDDGDVILNGSAKAVKWADQGKGELFFGEN